MREMALLRRKAIHHGGLWPWWFAGWIVLGHILDAAEIEQLRHDSPRNMNV